VARECCLPVPVIFVFATLGNQTDMASVTALAARCLAVCC
jgi:hypothetical protein